MCSKARTALIDVSNLTLFFELGPDCLVIAEAQVVVAYGNRTHLGCERAT